MNISTRLSPTNGERLSSTEDGSQRNTSLPADEDEVLVEKELAEKVNVADFEAIFLRYQTPITNYIYRMTNNHEQANDLAQDAFIKAYKALLGGTIVQPGALAAWLYRIASNTTMDAMRRKRLISWLPLSLFNDDRGIGAGVVADPNFLTDGFASNNDEQGGNGRAASVTSLYERNTYDGSQFESQVADREIVERVFQQLPEKYATCLWLYENDGLPCATIAQVLKITTSAVKMRLMRARERFISLYQKEIGED